MTENILTGVMVTIGICAIVIASSSVADSRKTLSRDFNQDGVVDVVDLSIMASEISTRNANK